MSGPAPYVVRTPENVVFEYELAGPATRASAWLVDRVVVGMASAAMGTAVQLFDLLADGLGAAVWLVVYFVLDWGYHACCEWRWGKTAGKALLGVRVMSDRGLGITFGQSVVRNLFRLLDSLPGVYLVGGVLAATDPFHRRAGDLAAGTVVVTEPARRSMKGLLTPTHATQAGQAGTAGSAAPAGRIAALDDAAAARVRRRVTGAQRDAIVALALRREELDLPVRVELFSSLSGAVQGPLGLPRPAGMSPENHVLRIAAALIEAPADDQRAWSRLASVPKAP